jgi:hypothetical protein
MEALLNRRDAAGASRQSCNRTGKADKKIGDRKMKIYPIFLSPIFLSFHEGRSDAAEKEKPIRQAGADARSFLLMAKIFLLRNAPYRPMILSDKRAGE